MKVVDESLWQQQCAELEADGQNGQRFRDYVQFWVDAAEEWVEKHGDRPVDAIRATLTVAEDKYGRIGIAFLGQMLVVISTYWIYGEQLAKDLSPIELHLVQDMLALKMSELAKEAETAEADQP